MVRDRRKDKKKKTEVEEQKPKREVRHRYQLGISIFYIILGSLFIAIGSGSIGAGARTGGETALYIVEIIGGGILIISALLLLTKRRFGWAAMVWSLIVIGIGEAALSAPGIIRIVQKALGNFAGIPTSIRTDVSSVIAALLALINFINAIYLAMPWVKRRFK